MWKTSIGGGRGSKSDSESRSRKKTVNSDRRIAEGAEQLPATPGAPPVDPVYRCLWKSSPRPTAKMAHSAKKLASAVAEGDTTAGACAEGERAHFEGEGETLL